MPNEPSYDYNAVNPSRFGRTASRLDLKKLLYAFQSKNVP